MSEDHVEETEQPRRLYGAAAAAAARKNPLASIMEGVDAAFEIVAEQVTNLEGELEEKRRELATLEALRAIRSGTFRLQAPPLPRSRQSASGTRARGETAARIMELLERERDGLGRGAIIERLGARDSKPLQSSISNSLVSLKKAGRIGHDTDSGIYRAA